MFLLISVIFDFIASLGLIHTSLPFIPCSLVIGGRLSSWQKIGLNETGTECTFVKSTGKNYRMNGWILCARHPSRVGRGDEGLRRRRKKGSRLVSGNFKTLRLWKLEFVRLPIIIHIFTRLVVLTYTTYCSRIKEDIL